MATKTCIGYTYGGVTVPAHDMEWNETNFPAWAMNPARPTVRCRECDRFRRTKTPPQIDPGTGLPVQAAGPIRSAPARKARPRPKLVDFAAIRKAVATKDSDDDFISEDEAKNSHEYIADPELTQLWNVVVNNTVQEGAAPANLVFFGPSGSGKTEGAQHLAALVGLPFTKVDAASMTDPESWFGTREVIVEQGVSVTKYIPSAFVEAVQRPGIVFIDEVTRVDDEHRNVLLPLTDGTGRVTNPLTGEQVVRDPRCFIIMAGNRGLQFTGTSAVDPAFTTRALTVEFDYIPERAEKKVAMDATGCDGDTATVFVKFANETRAKAKSDPDFPPISTREVIAACRLVAGGLNRDLAAKYAILNAASSEGGAASVRQELQTIWNGVRLTREEIDIEDEELVLDDDDDDTGWVCPVHKKVRTVPAGVSAKSGKPYSAFKACPEAYCDETENKRAAAAKKAGAKVCGSCNKVQPPGRITFCVQCGDALP